MNESHAVKLSLVAGWSVLAASLAAPSPVAAQHNPAGWIRPGAWNFLMPLLNDRHCHGGAALEENWLAPHEIGLEDPRAGDLWGDIDYSATALAAGWGGEALSPEPLWTSYGYLHRRFGGVLANCPLPVQDVVDLQLLVGGYNVDGCRFVPENPHGAPTDGVLAALTTYIDNRSEVPREVEICTASDDSIQVWLNNVRVTSVSVCRPLAPGCEGRRAAVLPPGVSKLAVLVWEGWGGWGLRIGLLEDGALLSDNSESGIVFLGAGDEDPSLRGQLIYDVARASSLDGSCPAGAARVTLTGHALPGVDLGAREVLSVTERITSRRPAELRIREMSPPARVEDVHGRGMTDDGFITSWLLLGPFEQPYGAAPLPRVFRLDYLTEGEVTEATVMPRAGEELRPDYGGAAAVVALGPTRDANPSRERDGPARWLLWQDPDDTIDFSEVYGDLDDVAAFAVTYLEVERDFAEVRFAYAADDSLALYVDEVGPVADIGIAPCGEPGTAPRFTVMPLAPGRHRLLVRVLEGAGAHCFRLRLEDAATGAPITSGIRVCTDPANRPEIGCNLIGRAITWEEPRARVDEGLAYTLFAPTGTTEHVATIGRETIASGRARLDFDSIPEGSAGLFTHTRDIGAPLLPGETVEDAGEYSMAATGLDIWEAGDQFHFAYREVTGDFIFEARMAQVVNLGGRWGKFGPMARWSCAPDARFAMIQSHWDAAGNPSVIDPPRYDFRPRHGQSLPVLDLYQADWGTFRAPQPPWMRLVRLDKTIYAYLADDDGGGAPRPGRWRRVGSDSAPDMPETLLVGMAASSNSPRDRAHLSFTDVFYDVPPPAGFDAGVECGPGAPILEADYGGSDGTVPAGATVVYDSENVFFYPRIQGGRLRLLEEQVYGSAAATWYLVPGNVLGDEGFVAEFDAFFTYTRSSVDPGDGLCFVAIEQGEGDPVGEFPSGLGLPSLVGGRGGAMGYGYGRLIQRTEGHPSFAVELDAWQNESDLDRDPPGAGAPDVDGAWHVALDLDGTTRSVQTCADHGYDPRDLPDIFASAGVHVTVTYEPAQGTAQARVSCRVQPGDRSRPAVEVLAAHIAALEGPLAFGFTAGSGIGSMTQEIDNFQLSRLTCGALPPPSGHRLVGDCNADARLDISDALCVLGHLFVGDPLELPCRSGVGDIALLDWNGDGSLTMEDGLAVVWFLYRGEATHALGRGCREVLACPDQEDVCAGTRE